MQPDHYEVLGVAPDADGATLRGAYLTLMRANHPDRRPGDAAAAAVARRANAAYDVLGDPQRRAVYDRRRAGPRPAPGPRPTPGPQWVTDPLTGAPRPRATGHANGYSPDREAYARAFSAATARFLVAVLAVGTLLLLVLAPR